jgi:hypothetical protein
MNRLARREAGATHASDALTGDVRFCSHCAVVSSDAPQRVCARCGLGVVLACAPGLLTRSGMPFLVVKSDLRISAASTAVESLLGDPQALIGQPLLDVVSGDPSLPRWIARAAMGSHRVTSVALRKGPRRVNGRIARCGDPAAALLILE